MGTVRGGKNLRNLRVNHVNGKGKKASPAMLNESKAHLNTEGLSSFTYESTKPFNLFLLQKLLSEAWLDYHIVRCKGLLYLAEDPNYVYRLNISGRKRYTVEVDGIWLTTPRSKVVFIAECSTLDDENLKRKFIEALDGACQSSTSSSVMTIHSEEERNTEKEKNKEKEEEIGDI